jgi:5-methylcytosine-specific restriction endonuclease McrA
MIKLPAEQTSPAAVVVKFACMICMAFPEVVLDPNDTKKWKQSTNPVPSNRMCLHVRHKLDCPTCMVEPAEEAEIRERYFIEPKYRDAILTKDGYTCQACGYRQTEKPERIPNKKPTESDAEYLYRRFSAGWRTAESPKSLVVAHFAKRYGDETYENRHKMENARSLCEDCHNMETALHQMEDWLQRKKTCPWLQALE